MKRLTKLLVIAVILSMAGNSFAKIKLAVWGDSRGFKEENTLAVHKLLLDDITDYDAHVHTGDFTDDGKQGEWDACWSDYPRIDEIVVEGKFFMCPSNHDFNSGLEPYLKNTRDFLPGEQTYYHHVIEGSDETVHIIVCNEREKPMPIEWLKDVLSKIPEDDYIVFNWHDPAYDITYKGDPGEEVNEWLKLGIEAGADFVVNGHAHEYVRTHVLDAKGNIVARGDADLVSNTDPNGIVCVVNGTAKGKSSKASTNKPPKVASFEKEDFSSVTFLTFDGNKTNLQTVKASDGAGHGQITDEWNWTQDWWETPIDESKKAVATASKLGIVPNKIESRISFKMQGAKSNFSLTVYNSMGKKLWNYDGLKREGTKEVVWDYSGNNIGSGVYFVKFDTPEKKSFQNFTITK